MYRHTIDVNSPLTCTSVSCGLLVLPDLSMTVISNEEPQVKLHYCNAETPTETATYRPVVPCLASGATHYDAVMPFR